MTAAPTPARRPLDDVHSLLVASLADPFGAMPPSPYDTGHQVRLGTRYPDRIRAALLTSGHDFLLRTQNADGSWGSPHTPPEYRLTATLAPVAGLLELCAHQPELSRRSQTRAAAETGLAFLTEHAELFAPHRLPDTLASEFVVPATLEMIWRALADTNTSSVHCQAGIAQALRACEADRIRWHEMVRAASQPRRLPPAVRFWLEIFDEPPMTTCGASHDVFVGRSPAATVAVLGWSAAPEARLAQALLDCAAQHHGGLPDVYPVPEWERLWLAASVARLNIPLRTDLSHRLADYFTAIVADDGVRSMGADTPPDADCTSTCLYVLTYLGRGVAPTALLAFEHDDCFLTYTSERNHSTSTNAHVLEALGSWIEAIPADASRYRPARDKAAGFLCRSQERDGSWTDKWHASPLYATASAAIALHNYGGRTCAQVVERAREWLLGSQRQDGSWGVWAGTLEETAYALQTLLVVPGDHRTASAIEHGARFLTAHQTAAADDVVHTPLWYGKDLFEPQRIVDTAVATVLYRAGCRDAATPPRRNGGQLIEKGATGHTRNTGEAR